MAQAACQRCGTSLRAVAFLDLKEDQGPDLDVYCGPCSKILEREALRSWAMKWARSLVDEDQHEVLFQVFAALWEQGFVKARTFEEAREVFTLEDNPFIDESGLNDPLKLKAGPASTSSTPPDQAPPARLDEDEYYESTPIFGRS